MNSDDSLVTVGVMDVVLETPPDYPSDQVAILEGLMTTLLLGLVGDCG